MALQGTLDTFALPDVLRLLAATKKTGRLRITGGRGTGSVWVSSGEVCGVEATHAPHAKEAVDALFELLRFQDGAFTFDAESTHDDPMPATDVEAVLAEAEALLGEWRGIEAVVPSLDAWVTLCQQLPAAELTLDQERWTTIVAVGGGATVRRIGDDLCLAELPVSRAIRDLVELSVVEVAETAPAGAVSVQAPAAVAPSAPPARPLTATTAPEVALEPLEPAPDAEPARAPAPRARRPKPASTPDQPEVFVPLELPGRGAPAPYDPVVEEEPADDAQALKDLVASFPGLAGRPGAESTTPEDEEITKQLATLSPRAAQAIRAAAQATTDEEREAALADADSEDEPLNRGLLLKFLSSVKS